MKIVIKIAVAVALGMSLNASCMSDFSCGIGHKCVKKPYQSNGVCMKSVNEYGVQQYNMPSTDSIGPNMNNNGCSFDMDCPIGFRCDGSYKTCVKR